jgi:hypothetical protein
MYEVITIHLFINFVKKLINKWIIKMCGIKKWIIRMCKIITIHLYINFVQYFN